MAAISGEKSEPIIRRFRKNYQIIFRKDADQANFFYYQLINKGQITCRNSWVTDILIDENNVAQLVKGGRARWKVENEAFNTLKNQGYHIEHNFGHGQKNLSTIFFLLNLLAFFVHQILELTDLHYQKFGLIISGGPFLI
jgi:hypothetical protein